MIQSKNGLRYQNTVKEKSPITKRCHMISHNAKKTAAYPYYVIMSEQNPSNAKLLP